MIILATTLATFMVKKSADKVGLVQIVNVQHARKDVLMACAKGQVYVNVVLVMKENDAINVENILDVEMAPVISHGSVIVTKIGVECYAIKVSITTHDVDLIFDLFNKFFSKHFCLFLMSNDNMCLRFSRFEFITKNEQVCDDINQLSHF
jgi:hypothetical protein